MCWEVVECNISGVVGLYITRIASHWSLLLVDNVNKLSFHFDSSKCLNQVHAKTLSVKLGVCESKFVEMPCVQQRNDFECGINLIVNLKFILNFYVIPKVAMRFYEWYCQCFVSKPIIVTSSSKPSTDIETTTASSPEHTQTPFPSTHCSQATESNKSESLIPKLTLFRSECGRWEIQKPKKSKRSPKKSSKLQNLTELAGGVTLYNSYSALQCEETLCHNTNSMNSDESKSNSYFSKTIRNNSFCPKIKNGTMVPKDLTKVLPSRKSVNAVNPKKDSTTILQCMSTSELDKHVKSSHKVLILSDSHGRTVGHNLNAATNDEHKTAFYEHHLKYNGIRLYNALPGELKSENNFNSFGNGVKKILLQRCCYSIGDFLS
ncbi:SUMO1 sentrin specific peptidase 8 [Homalodisca vitripennis]|nr:SUMO1 sentrin specific peptidase 8 [Homalodisca vitripennis]